MKHLVPLAFSTLLVAGAASQLAFKLDSMPRQAAMATGTQESARETEPRQANSGPRTVTIRRDHRGHYQVDASVNGRRIDLMVDTGASVVALTRRDAQRLGIYPAPRDFTAEVRTANGTVRAARARLDSIEIGGIRVRDVTALIAPDEALSENLLGLSFLSRLRRFEFGNDKLVLEQ
jgi:aspartyl protease family protein